MPLASTSTPWGIKLGRNLGRAYFALQAVAGTLWWICVFAFDPVRNATLGGLNPVLVAAFDLPLFVAASAFAAAGLRFAVWVTVPWTALVTVAMAVYATLTGAAGWGALLMIAATAGSTAAGILVLYGKLPTNRILFGPFKFRIAPARQKRAQLGRTGAQITVFWGLFLAVIPVVIVLLEMRWQLHFALPLWVRIGGGILLLAASALGLWAAATMSTLGDGTPLPAEMPRRLVIAGPYRWVRNPMAVSGILQGVSVGLITSSWLVVAYALCGSLAWNWLIRPLEEADLEERFGAEFTDYQARVACWVPRLGVGRPVQSAGR